MGNKFPGNPSDPAARKNFTKIELGLGITFAENPEALLPAPNTLLLFARDNGLGKTELVVVASTGSEHIIWTQP